MQTFLSRGLGPANTSHHCLQAVFLFKPDCAGPGTDRSPFSAVFSCQTQPFSRHVHCPALGLFHLPPSRTTTEPTPFQHGADTKQDKPTPLTRSHHAPDSPPLPLGHLWALKGTSSNQDLLAFAQPAGSSVVQTGTNQAPVSEVTSSGQREKAHWDDSSAFPLSQPKRKALQEAPSTHRNTAGRAGPTPMGSGSSQH